MEYNLDVSIAKRRKTLLDSPVEKVLGNYCPDKAARRRVNDLHAANTTEELWLIITK